MTKSQLVERLKEIGSEEPQSEAKTILRELFDASNSEMLLSPERDYASAELESLLERRAKREPLQYILGYAYFCDEKYYLNRDTLVPRSDTEMLVTAAVRLLKFKGRFADLCTGSGCVAISTLARRLDMSAVAVDISEGAVEAARKNARENGVADKLEIICADLRDMPLEGQFDAILSNPPYIRSGAIDTLSPELAHEPRIALDGGEDGMDFYRFIAKNYEKHLSAGGFFAFEIGYDQKDDIARIAEELGMSCEIAVDYSGNPRVAVLRRQSETEEDDGDGPMDW